MMEQGELGSSPDDIVLLDDDESAGSDDDLKMSPNSPLRGHEDEEEEAGPEIKPPQAKIKKDKHKHKHKREKKKSDDREKDRHSSHRRGEPQSRVYSVGASKHKDDRRVVEKDRHGDRKQTRDVREPMRDVREPIRDVREPIRDLREPIRDLREPIRDVREPVRDVRERDTRHQRDNRDHGDSDRRKRSMQDRERLEELETARHKVEKELKRKHEFFEQKEKMERNEREWERQKRANRLRAKDEEEQRKIATRNEVDRRRNREKGRHGRSRSPQSRRADDDAPRQTRDHKRERQGERSRRGDERRVVREEDYHEEEDAVEGEEEHHHQEEAEEQHHHRDEDEEDREEGHEEINDNPASPDTSAEESASETGSEESGSSSSEHEEEVKSSHKHKHPEKIKSKFESESEPEAVSEESDHQSPDEEPDYVELTPPESPIELKPDLPPYYPAIQGCRNVEEFSCLNRIEEGTYGVVYRAKDKKTEEIVALKRLKMEKEKEGFPITSLREINTLLKAQHPNIVTVREIVVGSNMDRIYIVMDYVEHDLKGLMETMKEDFLLGEVKTLMHQLISGVNHLHDNWIIHRDLKTSNLLFSHKGELKIGDFGLAREYGSPLKHYTPIVVTLWYRAPELLLCCKEYSTAIDMWSVGCIMAEFLTRKPLFPGKSEIDELNRIFKDLGTPNEKIWPGISELKGWKTCTFADYPYNNLRNRLGANITDKGFDLINRFLTYDPVRRITADQALKHEWFKEPPHAVDPSMFPTWPAKSEQSRRSTTSGNSPKPPSGGKAYSKLLGDDDEGGFHLGAQARGNSGPGFALKF